MRLERNNLDKILKSLNESEHPHHDEPVPSVAYEEAGQATTETVLDTDEDEYKTNGECYPITFIELAILNEYLHDACLKSKEGITVTNYGSVDAIGRISFGGAFNVTDSWWFQVKFPNDGNEYIFQSKMYMDTRKDMITELQISVKNGITTEELFKLQDKIKKLAFNNSKFVGKCVKVKIRDGNFKGIEIVDISNFTTELVLSKTQEKWIKHFIKRVGRGGHARYLLNGEPGTGKTESIRDIIRQLMLMNVTFIIPEFTTGEDLSIILEACEIFDRAVIIMDDIDLYLGSRDKGSYTTLLGQFLSFFDGVKKRKISLLASTNDKGLVDKAAERPGRFNMTLDYTFLTYDQLIKVCEIHLPKQYHTEDVYEALSGKIDGKKVNITGAFIANLADNIKEMSEDEDDWSTQDTLDLIEESYKGFYMSQVEKNSNKIGFQTEKR